MGNTNDVQPVEMSDRHIGDAMELVTEAGWNQCAQDWQMMLSAGRGFGFKDGSGKLIASAMVLPYGSQIGWIGMVLVTKSHQRKGLAGRMMAKAVRILEEAGLVPGLDATPAGEPVYLKQGFNPGFSFHRWNRIGSQSRNDVGSRSGDVDIAKIQHLDRAGFGAPRPDLLENIIQRGHPVAVTDDDTGFALSRAGRIADQIGPIIAQDETAAIKLFDQQLSRLKGDVFVDIPDAHVALTAHAEAVGFTRQRPFRRMLRNTNSQVDPGAIYALFGPEMG